MWLNKLIFQRNALSGLRLKFTILLFSLVILSSCGTSQNAIPTGEPYTGTASELIESMLTFSETIAKDTLSEVFLQQCKETMEMVPCIALGQELVAKRQYRLALDIFTSTVLLDPEIADGYYAIGNAYYDLALLDLIKRRRFSLDVNNMSMTLYPDVRTKIIFVEVSSWFDQATDYPRYNEIHPEAVIIVTAMNLTQHRLEQIQHVEQGESTLDIHLYELAIRVLTLPLAIFPEDTSLQRDVLATMEKLIKYISEHPGDFPGLPSQ